MLSSANISKFYFVTLKAVIFKNMSCFRLFFFFKRKKFADFPIQFNQFGSFRSPTHRGETVCRVEGEQFVGWEENSLQGIMRTDCGVGGEQFKGYDENKFQGKRRTVLGQKENSLQGGRGTVCRVGEGTVQGRMKTENLRLAPRQSSTIETGLK